MQTLKQKVNSKRFSKGLSQKVSRVVLWGAAATTLTAHAVSNGVPHAFPGLVKLVSAEMGSSCTGSVIGDSPIKVSVALHCLSNFESGGLAMKLPGENRMIFSQKAFVSQNADLQALLVKKRALIVEVFEKGNKLGELILKIKLLSNKVEEESFLGKLFTPNSTLVEQAKKKEEAEAELMKQLQTLAMEFALAQSALEEITMQAGTKFFDHEFVVITFAESLAQKEASVQDKVADLRILPLVRSEVPGEEIQVIVGGFGVRGEGKDRNLESSYLSANTASPSKRRKNVYAVFGYQSSDAKKLNIKPGSLGAALPGDSGGPVLTPYGMAGVASMINTYTSETPPRTGWKNDYEEDEPFAAYSYIQSLYPSTTSPVAKEILARVEAEVSAVVYADQIPGFEEVFYQEQSRIQNALAPLEGIPFLSFPQLGMN